MLTLILSLALCLPLVRTAPGWRVINGTEAEKFEFKSLVSISAFNGHICGGTLINANTVLTAAHCFQYIRPMDVEVHVNAHDLYDPPYERKIVGVEKIITHPLWNPNGFEYDFQILKLDGSIPESETVEYSPLPPSSKMIARTGDKCVVTGWGSTNVQGSPTSRKLMKGDMKVMDQQKCKLFYEPIMEAHLCAESAYISTSSCQGDSGGPLFCKSSVDGNTYQAGVVSFVWVPCGQKGQPAGFGRVTSAIDWIRSQM